MAELHLLPQSPGRPAHLPPSIIIISEVTTGFFGVQRAGPRQLPFGAPFSPPLPQQRAPSPRLLPARARSGAKLIIQMTELN